MPLVLVTGFPKENKMLVSFRSYFNTSRITPNYWVTEVADVRGSSMKEITIDFESFDDALQAEDFMNNVPYVNDRGHSYNLLAKLLDHENHGYGRNQDDRYQDDRSYRSRSPGYSNERYSSRRYSHDRDRSRSPLEDPSKLDVEIELLRKKRLLIEEERRLLLEKKKLEMIKEFGPNACVELDAKMKMEFGEGTSTLFQANATKELERDQRERDRLIRPQRAPGRPDPADRVRAPPPEQRALANIPKFVLPCRIILSQMKKAIKNKAPDLHERNNVTKMISANLRRRFAIVLEHKSYMPSDAIAKLYRQVYPTSTDAQFIDKILQDVRACHWPKREKSQKTLDRMAKRKAEKAKMKEMLAAKKNGNKPGPSTNAPVLSVGKKPTNAAAPSAAAKNNVKPEPKDQGDDFKPTLRAVVPAIQTQVKTEVVSPAKVKSEPNTSVVEEPSGGCEDDDDWAANGVDWTDDDSKDSTKPEN